MSYLLDYNPGTPQYTFPRRGGVQLSGTAIVHTAECAADNVGDDSSAEGCARMIANRADYGSYHRLVDSDSIIDMLPWEYEAWQDSETNNWAVGISAALRTSDWLTMPADRANKVYRNLAACAADFVAYMATKGVKVPLVRISGAEARARKPGFCAHGDSGVARSDPGRDFDWDKFFDYTQQALDGTTQEDELSAAEVKIIVDAINFAHGRLDTELPDKVAGAILKKGVKYRDPLTGAETDEHTSLGTVVAFSDFNAVQTRNVVSAAARAIVDAVKAAPAQDASEAAEAAYAKFLEKLDGIKVNLSVGSDESA